MFPRIEAVMQAIDDGEVLTPEQEALAAEVYRIMIETIKEKTPLMPVVKKVNRPYDGRVITTDTN